jgi:hypothetical protein
MARSEQATLADQLDWKRETSISPFLLKNIFTRRWSPTHSINSACGSRR